MITTVSVMLPLTALPHWYKGKVPTEPGLSTGQTDHLPALFSDLGANWSLHQDSVNEHHQYIQSYQPIKSDVGKANRATQKQIEPHKSKQSHIKANRATQKQIEPHKSLQKSFFKTPNIYQ
jgi:hypothetical protein